ncbi:MAG: pantoate--beta-alanine ligase [Peptococcaceae bacterium]|jgi:pantoate--beta-alanine ligase|nr:pantoate--beta-alanine ligase [Peptococcaceae bacterium]
MKITEYIAVLRENVKQARNQGKTIVLIPTMGFLHYGHLSMVEAARQGDEEHERNYIVMSIFVNPLQFGPNEDYDRYPRDLIRDSRLAQEAGVDLLFVPSVQEMYPEGESLTTVNVTKVSAELCGAHRPGHFQGVATVVNKLFNIVLPDVAYFGQKDYQQFIVIKQMVKDLNIPLKIALMPTIREADGLALSSRNSYLNPEQRKQAPVLFNSLRNAAELIQAGERNPEVILNTIEQRIRNESDGQIEYIEIRKAENLEKVEKINGSVVIALAVHFGSTRLIDNIIVEV